MRFAAFAEINLGMPEASYQVVVDHPDCLHEGVAYRRPNELESAPEQVLAHGVRFGRSRRNLLQRLPGIPAGLSTDEAPDVGVKAAEFLLHSEKGLRVLDGGGELEPVAHDAGVGKERPDFTGVVTRDLPGIEVVEGTAVVGTLVQNGGPTQASLSAFENQELEEGPIVMAGHPPLLIVVLDVEGPFCPGAAGQGVCRIGWVHNPATVTSRSGSRNLTLASAISEYGARCRHRRIPRSRLKPRLGLFHNRRLRQRL